MTNRDLQRDLARAALRIAPSSRPLTPHPLPTLPERRWQEMQRAARRHRLARERGWNAAAGRAQGDLAHGAGVLISYLRDFQDLQGRAPASAAPSATDVLRDLLALAREFPDVRCDLKNGTISAVTEPIELEGIELGPFEIRLHWRQIGERRAYEVIALDENPAASNSSVTHPHVQDDVLCEGDGAAAIRKALKERRLLDFFLLVRQTLQTYRDGGAYVRLSLWHGVRCEDCGERVSEDCATVCERCGCDLCDSCDTRCHRCNDCFCRDCHDECARCDESICKSCLQDCRECKRRCCADCLTEGRCEPCQPLESDPDEELEHDDQAPAAPPAQEERADAAAEPLRLGEAAVSA